MKTSIGAGCMDCTLITRHPSAAQAIESLRAHVTEWPDHRPLIDTPANGWHRLFLKRQLGTTCGDKTP